MNSALRRVEFIPPLFDLAFGVGSNGSVHIGRGWSGPERDFQWTLGGSSELTLPELLQPDEYVLELHVSPFVRPGILPRQRLAIWAGDCVVASFSVDRPTVLSCRLPRRLIASERPLVLTFSLPDARSPSEIGASGDTRSLALAFHRVRLWRLHESAHFRSLPPLPLLAERPGLEEDSAGSSLNPADAAEVEAFTGLPLDQLMLRFESLGHNCEFGLVQRRCGAEPLGLLRFSGTFLRDLLRGLEADFTGVGAPEAVRPFLTSNQGRREFMVVEENYGLQYHTFIYEDQATIEQVREQESRKLKFLRRKFLEDLQDGEKIFVCVRSNPPLSESEMLPLLFALRRHGPGTLLWIEPADEDNPPGSVASVGPGLLRGFIDRFAPGENAHDLSLRVWLSLCANAYVLSQRSWC